MPFDFVWGELLVLSISLYFAAKARMFTGNMSLWLVWWSILLWPHCCCTFLVISVFARQKFASKGSAHPPQTGRTKDHFLLCAEYTFFQLEVYLLVVRNTTVLKFLFFQIIMYMYSWTSW